MKGFTRLDNLKIDDKEILTELLNEYLEDNNYIIEFYSREDNDNKEIIINSFDIIDTNNDNYLIIYDISSDDNITLNEDEYLVITFNTLSMFHHIDSIYFVECTTQHHIDSIYFMECTIQLITYDTIEMILPELLDYIE